MGRVEIKDYNLAWVEIKDEKLQKYIGPLIR